MVIFRDQRLTDAQLRDFAARFGPLEIGRPAARPAASAGWPSRRSATSPTSTRTTSVRRLDDRRRLDSLGNRLWHTDASYMPVPVVLGMLHAVALPPPSPFGNGETEFADMRAAYDALPDAMKQAIDGLVVEHDIFWSRGQIGFTEFPPGEREQYPPSPQRLVRTHPGSRRKTLYLSAHASHIVGWPVADGRLLLWDLTAHATQRAVRLQPHMAGRRSGDLGQPLHHASRPAARRTAAARPAPGHNAGYRLDARTGGLSSRRSLRELVRLLLCSRLPPPSPGSSLPMPGRPIYQRVLLKLSGEALMGRREYGLDNDTVRAIAADVGDVAAMGVQVCIVIGGGNIFRGVSGAAAGMERAQADYMGMLATVMNALGMQSALEKMRRATRVQSAIPMSSVCEPYIRRRAERHMEKGRVVIFAAGTGNPFFTTDTAAALRATEMRCDALLKGTQVDGVYSADPRKVPDAERYDQLTYHAVLANDLGVMDAAAISLARENNLPIVVFNIHAAGAFAAVIRGEGRFTRIIEQQ